MTLPEGGHSRQGAAEPAHVNPPGFADTAHDLAAHLLAVFRGLDLGRGDAVRVVEEVRLTGGASLVVADLVRHLALDAACIALVAGLRALLVAGQVDPEWCEPLGRALAALEALETPWREEATLTALRGAGVDVDRVHEPRPDDPDPTPVGWLIAGFATVRFAPRSARVVAVEVCGDLHLIALGGGPTCLPRRARDAFLDGVRRHVEHAPAPLLPASPRLADLGAMRGAGSRDDAA